jgi:DNA-directed RNA polymerase subunit RPC12/RpoP
VKEMRDKEERKMIFKGHRGIERPDGSTEDSWYPFRCATCERDVSGAVVARAKSATDVVRWLQCPHCGDGAVQRVDKNIYPGVAFGVKLEGLPEEVERAYTEARNCMAADAYAACELVCRKILMYVAVEKGAKEGESFSGYLSYLREKGFVTDAMMGWVKIIKESGNKATHEIERVDKGRGESTVMFTAELLRIVYEMEFMAKKYEGKREEAK